VSAFFLKLKIWRIEAALRRLLRTAGVKPSVWSFGAYYIDPKYLVFVVGVPSDKEKEVLKKDTSFTQSVNDLLVKYNWPIKARSHVSFDIESQETVDSERRMGGA
jgi:hypothetical protein